MHTREVRKGEFIFRQGEMSDCVAYVTRGRVEVLRELDGQYVVIGHVTAGEYVGEMGVLEDKPRSATVRAVENSTMEFTERDEFLRLISEDSEQSLELLVRLSARLREADGVVAEALSRKGKSPKYRQTGPVSAASETVTILAGSKKMQHALPEAGVEVDVFPFFVGRSLQAGEQAPPITIDLLLDDERPYRLSNVHFAITETNGSYVVRDFGSELGTAVNGELLGGDFFRSDSTPLLRGVNRVAAGGVGSPFMFRVRVD